MIILLISWLMNLGPHYSMIKAAFLRDSEIFREFNVTAAQAKLNNIKVTNIVCKLRPSTDVCKTDGETDYIYIRHSDYR